jgi:hypothetical protein
VEACGWRGAGGAAQPGADPPSASTGSDAYDEFARRCSGSRADKRCVAVSEHSTIGSHDPVPGAIRPGRQTGDRRIERQTPGRAEVGGVPEGEDTAAGATRLRVDERELGDGVAGRVERRATRKYQVDPKRANFPPPTSS